MSLKDDQGRNVLDVWRKRITLAGNNYPVTSGPASNEQLVSLSNLKNLNSKITLDNICADQQEDGRERDEKQGLNMIQADVQLSSASQADEQIAFPTLPVTSLLLDQLCRSSFTGWLWSGNITLMKD